METLTAVLIIHAHRAHIPAVILVAVVLILALLRVIISTFIAVIVITAIIMVELDYFADLARGTLDNVSKVALRARWWLITLNWSLHLVAINL